MCLFYAYGNSIDPEKFESENEKHEIIEWIIMKRERERISW